MSSISLVDDQNLSEYPISSDQRLESHFYVEWHHRRWLNSRFRMLAEPEVRAHGFDLFFIAQDQSPVGTLPVDDRMLARYLGVELEHWKSLCARKISPLYNWHRVRCSNGEIRWAHPAVTEMAVKALGLKEKNAARLEAARQRKRFKDLTRAIERIGAKHLLKAGDFIERFDLWLLDNRANQNRTEGMLRSALDEFCSSG